MSPEEEPPTIIEANSSASEFNVTVPLFVKSPESVRSELAAIVKLPPLSTVIVFAAAVVEFPEPEGPFDETKYGSLEP